MIFYDKPFYLSCIVYLPAFKGFADDVAKFLEEKFGAKDLKSPADFAAEVTKEMSNAGYPKFKALPLTVSPEESLVILARCLKKFNNSAAVRVQPTPARVNRDIVKEKDFIRLVNDLLLQQDNISLSQIWNTNSLPQVVFTQIDSPLSGRLARTVINTMEVSDPTAKKKVQLEQVLDSLHSQILANLEFAKNQISSAYQDGKYQLI